MLSLARKELEAARKQDLLTAELFDDLGTVAERLGEFDKALDAYGESLKLKGSRALEAKVHTKRGWIFAAFLKSPDFPRARDEFTEAVHLDPTHADAHAGLGFVRAVQRAPAEAQREAGLALFHEGDNYGILHNVACVYAVLAEIDIAQKKPHQDAAIDYLRRAVQLCRDTGYGKTEVENIEVDPAFARLRGVQDFWERIGVKK
jgi:tetratricopeptide (TPR) repeat protein